MAEVSIEVGGRHYPVNCRDGEEDHVRMIAGLVDAKAKDAQRAVGGVNETRHLLLAALLLADEINDIRTNGSPTQPAPAEPLPDFAPLLEKLADRIESVAERLETKQASA